MVLEALSAGTILSIAFESAIALGCEKAFEGAVEQGKALWGKVRQRLAKQPAAEAALVRVEASQELESLESEVIRFLQAEMLQDPAFAQELTGMAQQIMAIREGHEDRITIHAESHDESTQKVVGKIEANKVNF